MAFVALQLAHAIEIEEWNPYGQKYQWYRHWTAITNRITNEINQQIRAWKTQSTIYSILKKDYEFKHKLIEYAETIYMNNASKLAKNLQPWNITDMDRWSIRVTRANPQKSISKLVSAFWEGNTMYIEMKKIENWINNRL